MCRYVHAEDRHFEARCKINYCKTGGRLQERAKVIRVKSGESNSSAHPVPRRHRGHAPGPRPLPLPRPLLIRASPTFARPLAAGRAAPCCPLLIRPLGYCTSTDAPKSEA